MKRYSTFIGGSAIGMAIDYAITILLADIAHLNPVLALAAAMIVSASVVFLFHNHFTFSTGNTLLGRRYFSFMLWSFVVFLLRALLLQLLLKLALPLSPALVLSMLIVSVVNYLFSAAVIFAKARP